MLVDAIGPSRNPERTPLFNVMLDFVDHPDVAAVSGGVSFTPLDLTERMPRVDLMLYVKRQDEGFNVRLHYRPANFAPAQASDLLQRFQRLIELVIEAPDAPIAS